MNPLNNIIAYMSRDRDFEDLLDRIKQILEKISDKSLDRFMHIILPEALCARKVARICFENNKFSQEFYLGHFIASMYDDVDDYLRVLLMINIEITPYTLAGSLFARDEIYHKEFMMIWLKMVNKYGVSRFLLCS